MEVKASYAEIFLGSTYDVKIKFEPVMNSEKGDDR